ncbi:MAG: serine/threonine protein kinase, partial [Acidobacteria bacterium]|nr:serine/threonine protein kinase [Acidobacteriota bacterium]
AWSPDGRSIAFLRKLSTEDWSLLIVPPLGGQERVLVESGVSVWDYGPNLAWTPDSKWLAFPWAEPGKAGPGLFLLSVQTLEKRRLTSGKDASPAFPPDGRALVFTRWHADASDIYLLHLGVDYAPKGAAIRVAAGEPFVLSAAWTSDGREIVSSISSYSRGSIWRMEASPSAKPRRLPLPSEGVGSLALSRQGDRLAYTVPRNRSSIWRIDLSGSSQPPGTTSPLIQSTRSEGMPAYSQDGRKIAFTSERSGQTEIWVCDSDGSNAVQLTSSLGGETFGPKWSPDGRNIAFVVETRGHGEVYILSSKGGSPRRLTSNPTDTTPWPCWSGDGQSIYFRSTRGGTSEIWKMPAAGGDAVQITPNGDERDLPQESPDGKYLYYVKADRYPEQCSVWRMPSGGGEENRVLESTSCGGPFAVVERGIYFITPSRSDISYYDFSSGSTRKVVTAKRAAFIEASPDGRTILYTQVDEVGSDLMLVENFR